MRAKLQRQAQRIEELDVARANASVSEQVEWNGHTSHAPMSCSSSLTSCTRRCLHPDALCVRVLQAAQAQLEAQAKTAQQTQQQARELQIQVGPGHKGVQATVCWPLQWTNCWGV